MGADKEGGRGRRREGRGRDEKWKGIARVCVCFFYGAWVDFKRIKKKKCRPFLKSEVTVSLL